MTTDSQTEVLAQKMLDISIAVFPKREFESIFSKHKLQASTDVKPALLGSHLSAQL